MGAASSIPLMGQAGLSQRSLAWALAGLTVAMVTLAWLSHQFPYGTEPIDAPLLTYVGFAALAGAMFLWMVSGLPAHAGGRLWLWMLVLGLVLRLTMFASLPVFEDDWYRYLWDGASVAKGIDPYAFAPAAAVPVDAFGQVRPISDDADLATLQALAAQSSEVHSRINYPYLSTIYPPVAQGAFALAHWISPFSLNAWRGVLLLADIGAVLVLLGLLRHIGQPLIWSAVYWLNPLVILQVFGAGHMDGLLVPFLLAALWMGLAARPAIAAVALAAAVGVKLWPLLLFPALAVRYLGDWKAFGRLCLTFGLVTAVLLLPQALRALEPSDGLGAYSTSWQTHSLFFPILQNAVFGVFENGDLIARMVVALIVLGVVLIVATRHDLRTGEGLAAAWLLPIGALIFLSPTGYPWYVVWAAALLPLVGNRGLLIMAMTWPLYYFRFLLGDDDPVYLWVIVPLAFLPALILFLRDGFQKRVPA